MKTSWKTGITVLGANYRHLADTVVAAGTEWLQFRAPPRISYESPPAASSRASAPTLGSRERERERCRRASGGGAPPFTPPYAPSFPPHLPYCCPYPCPYCTLTPSFAPSGTQSRSSRPASRSTPPHPPSLPYTVDTSRPSLRTDRTRLVPLQVMSMCEERMQGGPTGYRGSRA